MMKTFDKNNDPMDDRLETYSLNSNEFLVFDIFKNLPKNYFRKEGQMFNIPIELSEINFVIFNGNLEGVFYDKDPRQVFVAQEFPDGGIEVIKEAHKGDCFVFNPPFILVMQRKIVEEFFSEDISFDFSMN